MIVGAPFAARAETVEARIAAARQLYDDGRAIQARDALIRLANGPDARTPPAQKRVLGALLDVCIASYADDCVIAYAERYVAAAKPGGDVTPVVRAELARDAGYYFDAYRLALNRPDVTATIFDWAPWKMEDPAEVELYLRRHVLGAKVAMAQGKPALALEFLDRSLALTASLQDLGASRRAVAQHLAQAIALLAELGQTERAYGLMTATGGFVGETLPPRSMDAGLFAVTAGSLLGDVGDLKGAARMLAQAAPVLQAMELDEPTRDWLLGTTLRLKAAIAAPQGDVATARRAIDAHPMGRFYERPGRTPESRDEVAYLAARALTAAVERKADPVALTALTATPDDLASDAATRREIAVFRNFGRLMLMPPGPERSRVLAEFARQTRDEAVASVAATPGAWYRPSPIDKVLLALALSGADADDADRGDLAFSLLQLSSRFGPSFDSDALTALGQAKTTAERETIHRALRLRAGRDRVERTTIQAVVSRPPGAGAARFEPAALKDFLAIADGVDGAERAAIRAGAPMSGANVVALKRFQAALAPDEAALSVSLTVGGLDYMCVRRDGTVRFRRNTDLSRLVLDARLLNVALTATHAPDEDADAQFPVETAVRIYDDLIRPFEGCLRPGDRIVWLAPVADFSVPLAALLPAPPPRLGEGWELSRADWLVKRHAISYPGSAAMVVATRGRPPEAGAAPDFLGVGDPILTGRTLDGQVRGKALLRGVRGEEIAELAPLPDTAEELRISARGFRAPRLLLQRDATEHNVRGELAHGYRYLSFATHGLIRDDLQGLSEPALVLTPVAMADPTDDGLLTASEIADFSLAARFVALSACNTANFDLAQMARELPALASAFAVAGVPATLGTLWPVNSETGKAVVSDTFTRLRDRPPAVALAEAQRAFLAAPPSRPYLHPRFWAPFIVLGDGG